MVSCGRSSQKEGYPGATNTATTMATTTTALLIYYAALERAGAGPRRLQEAPGGSIMHQQLVIARYRYTVSAFTWALWWHTQYSIFFKRERERKVQRKST